MTIVATNNHGDIILWRDTRGKLTIRTSAGSIIVQGQSQHVLKRWETLKKT